MIDADRMFMLIEEHLKGRSRDEHRAFLREHDIDQIGLAEVAVSNARTAVATHTELGVAAVFMQGFQLGLLVADHRAMV